MEGFIADSGRLLTDEITAGTLAIIKHNMEYDPCPPSLSLQRGFKSFGHEGVKAQHVEDDLFVLVCHVQAPTVAHGGSWWPTSPVMAMAAGCRWLVSDVVNLSFQGKGGTSKSFMARQVEHELPEEET
jgi:hypothetical protein